jgi:UDP-N-acetylglucosamine--N-acetylmuramyl-(pentapeptide) pyrophosphoryl-undecaprenol N-acetylglucosamine transferase
MNTAGLSESAPVPVSPLHVVFAGGGTAGHLFPGLAVAEQLAKDLPGLRVTFAGTGRELERQWVTDAGFAYLALDSRPLPRGLRGVLPFLYHQAAGYLRARRFLIDRSVRAVVGLGGYASVPMAHAAARCRLPLILLEQNAVPGRATRWLARRATVVCTAFRQSHGRLPPGTARRMTGNPLRRGFVTRDQDHRFSARARRLVVLGGSSGAQSLNEAVPRALVRIRTALAGWTILHQAGASQQDATQARYRQLGLNAEVVPFLDDMPAVLARTDLAICRAGGTTLAELAASGVPAILIPYPHAADAHQHANAQLFAAAGAARVLDQRQSPWDAELSRLTGTLLSSPSQRTRMALAMRRLALPDAAGDVATLVRQVVTSHG